MLSDYDANALLDFYAMHLLSTAQWHALLGPHAHGRLLDVGAGSGDVTASLAPLFDAVTTTEASRGMARRLRVRPRLSRARSRGVGAARRRASALRRRRAAERPRPCAAAAHAARARPCAARATRPARRRGAAAALDDAILVLRAGTR
jgi:hypothetical protein